VYIYCLGQPYLYTTVHPIRSAVIALLDTEHISYTPLFICVHVHPFPLVCLHPYPQPIVEVLATAIQRYGRRNLRLAYDSLGTLCEAASSRWGVYGCEHTKGGVCVCARVRVCVRVHVRVCVCAGFVC